MGSKDKYGYRHDDGSYSKMTGNDKNVSYSIYDKNPSEEDHSGTHINYNKETGKGSIVEHGPDGKPIKSDISCYLTTACMRYFQNNFDDNSYELTVLRWFRDNYVTKEDIYHYYKVAPYIVEGINNSSYSNLVYNYIFDNIICDCISYIENGDYISAYNLYKNTVLNLEEKYARPLLEKKIVNVLKRTI